MYLKLDKGLTHDIITYILSKYHKETIAQLKVSWTYVHPQKLHTNWMMLYGE